LTTKSILITGGAGFIGSNLVHALTSEGHLVKAFDSFDPQVHPEGTKDEAEIEVIRGDMRDVQSLRGALEDVEIIFHEAAAVGVAQSMFQIRKYVEVNTLGTANLLDILANEEHEVKKLIVASSNTIYGEGRYRCPNCGSIDPGPRPQIQLRRGEWEMRCPHCGLPAEPIPTDEGKPPNPTTVYAVTKRDEEDLSLTVGRAYDIPVVVLRYFNVLGPGQSLANPYTGVCAIFSSRIRHGKAPVVYEDGLQSRDLVSVHDVVQANLLAMRRRAMNFDIFNVGTGTRTTILSIAEELLRLHGEESLEPCVSGKFREGDVRHCYADISKISAQGYRVTVPFEKALREFFLWSRDRTSEDRFQEAEEKMDSHGLLK